MTPDAIESNPTDSSPSQSRLPLEIAPSQAHATSHAAQLMSPIEPRYVHSTYPLAGDDANGSRTQAPNFSPELLIDTFFARIHGKPYYILDEATTRQRIQTNQLPGHLVYAVYAVSARYVASI
jgi:hypothetical protein